MRLRDCRVGTLVRVKKNSSSVFGGGEGIIDKITDDNRFPVNVVFCEQRSRERASRDGIAMFNQRELEKLKNTKEIKPVKKESLSSSFIKSIDYDYDESELILEFAGSEQKYSYFNVPYELYEKLNKAKSKGRFYNEHIKGKYRSKKVTQKVPLTIFVEGPSKSEVDTIARFLQSLLRACEIDASCEEIDDDYIDNDLRFLEDIEIKITTRVF